MPDIQSLIEQMTLEEKAALCTGASAWTTLPLERLGLPELLVSDGPHGVRRLADIHTILIPETGPARRSFSFTSTTTNRNWSARPRNSKALPRSNSNRVKPKP